METLPETMQGFVKHIVNVARDVLEEAPVLPPVAFLINSEKKTAFALHSGVFSSKEKFMSALRCAIDKIIPDAILVVSEAWTVQREANGDDVEEYLKTHESLETHPDAIEAVFFSLHMPDMMFLGMAPITRNGESRTFGEVAFKKPQQAEGTFSNLFPRNETLH